MSWREENGHGYPGKLLSIGGTFRKRKTLLCRIDWTVGPIRAGGTRHRCTHPPHTSHKGKCRSWDYMRISHITYKAQKKTAPFLYYANDAARGTGCAYATACRD